MAVESPPWALQTGSYTAEQTRRAVFSWLARTGANSPGIVSGGLLSSADCQLSAPGSGMSVNISTGEVLIGGSEGGAQGAGYGRATSTTNLAISAANPSNPRIDLVCATMSDAGYTEPTGGSGNQWAFQVITGTPTASASLANLLGVGSLPLSSLLIGYCLVPISAANIITADLANVATVAKPQFIGTTGLADGQPLVWRGSSTNQWITLPAGGGNATFLQLFSAQNLKVQSSTVTVTWNSSSATAAPVAVSFPVTFPTSVQALIVSSAFTSTGAAAIANTTSLTTSGFSVGGYTPAGSPVNGTTAVVSWVALGI